MKDQPKIAVLGGGSWATAIVKMLSENLTTVGWYMRSVYASEHIKINKHNPNYCLLYTSPSPRDRTRSRMPSSA